MEEKRDRKFLSLLKENDNETIREKIRKICRLISENKELRDLLVIEDFSGSITLHVEPNRNRITRVSVHWEYRVE